MDDIFLRKLIYKCLQQYHYDEASIALSEEDCSLLIQKIQCTYAGQESELYEIVEDVVYEYITTG